MRYVGLVTIGAVVLGLAGCTSTQVKVAHSVDLAAPAQVVPEEQLLDVGIRVFDSGVPDGEIPREVLEELIAEGTFVHIRRMESVYLAVRLQDTLQRSGHFGSVWVTPEATNAADVNITAEILQSDGNIVHVRAKAVDATGRVWVDKDYEHETAAGAFNRQRYPELDPYQDLFNLIANDLAAALERLSGPERSQVRTVASLRYAEELAPAAFAGYVEPKRNGLYEVQRLPASGDPMYDRTERARQRERLFVETLNDHYEGFAQNAMPAYDSWREFAREESIYIRELTRSARWRTGLGVATILASVVYGTNSTQSSFTERMLRDAVMYIGVDVLRSSSLHRQEKQLHTSTLEELSLSFSDSVRPMVVEIAGTQHRLQGTAEIQYQEWKELLRQLFIEETGFTPEDIDMYIEGETGEGLQPGIELAPPVTEQEQQQEQGDPGSGATDDAAGSAEPPTGETTADAGSAPNGA